MINNEERCDGDGTICIDCPDELGQAMWLLEQQIQSHKLNKEQRNGCWTEAAAQETASLGGLAKMDEIDPLQTPSLGISPVEFSCIVN